MGSEFVDKLDPIQKEELVYGLKKEKDRKEILRAFDPYQDFNLPNKPYWQDLTQLRDVTSSRLGILGQEDNTGYAQEQFRAGARE